MPPVAPLADLHILAPMVDGLLMIVRAGITPKPAIERALAGLDASRSSAWCSTNRAARAHRRLQLRRLRLHRGMTINRRRPRPAPRSTVMQLFNRYVSTRSLTVFGGELLLIFGSVALAASLQTGGRSRRQPVEDRAGDGRLPAVPLLQRLLRPHAGPLEPRADRPPAPGRRRRLDRPRRALLHGPGADDRRRHLRVGAVRVPGRHSRLAPALQPA